MDTTTMPALSWPTRSSPGAVYTEKQVIYVNTEGRAGRPPGLARKDLRALSDIAGAPLPYDTLDELQSRLEDLAPHLVRYVRLEMANFFKQAEEMHRNAAVHFHGDKVEVPKKSLQDIFTTDPITRASPTMAMCVMAVTGTGNRSINKMQQSTLI